nr:MAG TPA: hypothetical protein [Caudoviricetes sp.]
MWLSKKYRSRAVTGEWEKISSPLWAWLPK